MNDKYQVIFAGCLLPGFDPDQVKQKLASLFKTNNQQIEKLFTGQRLVIKDQLDYELALKYQAAIRAQGADCEVKQCLESTTVKPTENITTSANRSSAQQPSLAKSEFVEKKQSQPMAATTDYWHKGIESFEIGTLVDTSIAEPGVQLVKPQDVEPVTIKTEHLSMAERGATLAKKEQPAMVQIATDHLKIVGDD